MLCVLNCLVYEKLQLIHKVCNCHSSNTAIRYYITIRNYTTWLITLNFNVCIFTAGLHKTVYKMYYKIFYNFHMICIMEYYWILYYYWWNTNIIYIYIYNGWCNKFYRSSAESSQDNYYTIDCDFLERRSYCPLFSTVVIRNTTQYTALKGMKLCTNWKDKLN